MHTCRRFGALVAVSAGLTLGGASAWAQTPYVNQPLPEVGRQDVGAVLGSSGSRPALSTSGVQTPVVQAARQQATNGIAFTGADVAGMVVLGVALAATGTAVVRLARRPNEAPTADA